ncbi:MAG: hypothetical protein LC777_01095 [Actinobacteria bacterium]|nr:hypothetical protein [Actinomycetota bacterium]
MRLPHAPADLRKLRTAQSILDDALQRMATGEIAEARRLAARAQPLVAELKPAGVIACG